jgi:CubicO group peptidase (beta-lactamase class C family)
VRRAIAALLLALAVAASASAGPPPPHANTKAALAALVRAGAPGAVIALRSGSSLTVLEGSFSDPRTHRLVRAGDHFRIGSITKIFVATVVLQLVAEGRLTLADTVEQRLPGLVPGGDRITLRELLQHTSGLYDYTDDPRTFAPYLGGKLAYAWKPRDLLAIAVSHKPLFAPGARWSYSNTNYLLLGLIVEAVTKDSLGGELARRIFRPLGLRQTRFEPGTHVAAPAAHGYYKAVDVTGLNGSAYWAAAGGGGRSRPSSGRDGCGRRVTLKSQPGHAPVQISAVRSPRVAGGLRSPPRVGRGGVRLAGSAAVRGGGASFAVGSGSRPRRRASFRRRAAASAARPGRTGRSVARAVGS